VSSLTSIKLVNTLDWRATPSRRCDVSTHTEIISNYLYFIQIRDQYCCLLDLVEVDLDLALRQLLQTLRLPKEAQCIDRLLYSFAYMWYEKNKDAAFGSVSSGRAAHRLAYSVLLLNTDLYNPHVMEKMTFAQYVSNLQGMNDGKDFSLDLLTSYYQSIASDEIVFDDKKGRERIVMKQGWMRESGGKQVWVVLEPPFFSVYKNPTVMKFLSLSSSVFLSLSLSLSLSVSLMFSNLLLLLQEVSPRWYSDLQNLSISVEMSKVALSIPCHYNSKSDILLIEILDAHYVRFPHRASEAS
jgi:hypothetical protein